MHAWLPYMKQNDKLTLHQILSKLTGWSIDEMHAWLPYMKQKDKLTLHQNFEQTYRL